MFVLGFHGKSRFTFLGIREIKNLFPESQKFPREIFILFIFKFLILKHGIF